MNKQLLLQINSLRENILVSHKSRVNCHWQIGEALNGIYKLLIESATEEERKMMESLFAPINIKRDGPYTVHASDALRFCDQLGSILEVRVAQQPSSERIKSGDGLQRVVPDTNNVFIIHGHDITNTLRLRALLADRYGVSPIILSEKPSKGRTIIEKFEEEAANTSFAFALITPDDLVYVDDKAYAQARPNVVFEIGWFYGRLGRKRVCILFKEGSLIHSDLDGVLRIQFRDSVDEKIVEIENELKAAGLL